MTGRPARFHVANMREVIAISRLLPTVDSLGQPLEEWQPVHPEVPAKWEPTAGTENVRGRVVESGVSVVFTIRAIAGITPRDRVSHKGTVYGIEYVKPVEGYPRFQELHCKHNNDG